MTDQPKYTPVPGGFSAPLAHRQVIYRQCRRSAAMASGLEAMAVRAFEVGEATPEQLEHFAELTTLLSEQIAQMNQAIAELITTR